MPSHNGFYHARIQKVLPGGVQGLDGVLFLFFYLILILPKGKVCINTVIYLLHAWASIRIITVHGDGPLY